MKKNIFLYYLLISLIFIVFYTGCKTEKAAVSSKSEGNKVIQPVVITDTTLTDTDDPAIWIDKENKDNSLVIGTDKDRHNGGLYAFNLKGKIVRTALGLKDANNVDVAYGLKFNGSRVDIAVTTERYGHRIRIYSLPALKAIDGGGIPVLKRDKEKYRQPMGIGLYTRPSDHAIFAIISRKTGPHKDYLEEYLLQGDGHGQVTGKLVRKFGRFSGKKEIEAVAVDNEMGYVYYCDETAGIRKYYADPAKGNQELAFFGQGDFKRDNEGISIYQLTDSTGYIIVSDQQANRFNIYPRRGRGINHNKYKKIASIPLATVYSDGSEVTSVSLPGFSHGLFVAMSDDKTFQYYRWEDIAENYGLKVKK
jgi:3-phytase